MSKFASFLYSVAGGAAIAIGGVVFLAVDNKIIGSLFFTVGLFTVCVNGLNLYTGKVGYIFDNKPSYLLFLGSIWLGNLVGTVIPGYLIRATRIASLSQKAQTLVATKLNDNLLSIFILAVFCGILMFIAVDSFKNNPHDFGKYLGLLFCVPVFILCSFEHCVANMFYFSIANMWSAKAVLYLIVMTLGNSVGGVLLPLARKLKLKAEAGATASTAGKR